LKFPGVEIDVNPDDVRFASGETQYFRPAAADHERRMGLLHWVRPPFHTGHLIVLPM
jgi:hypothetical protein